MDPSENVLNKFSKGPFDEFKHGEFSRDEGVVEELLGSLGSLRRNQWIVEIGYDEHPKFVSLAQEHDMNVLLVRSGLEPSDVRGVEVASDLETMPADPAVISFFDDAYETWESLDASPPVVVARIDPTVPPGAAVGPTTFDGMIELGARKGYVPVCHADGLIFVHRDLVRRLHIPGVNIRDPSRLFEHRV